VPEPGHVHDYRILVGNAPITMMAGSWLPVCRACPCGYVIYVGSYFYDPAE
jgi:hypothetical protein